MNNRSHFAPWLIPAAALILISNTIIHGHAQPHIEQPVEVSFVFPCETLAVTGSVFASTAQMLKNNYVIK